MNSSRGRLPDLESVAELLKQLQVMSRAAALSNSRSRRVCRKVQQWVRNLNYLDLRRRMQIDPAAAHVKYVFSVLQTLQVMMPACLERCLCRLRWADSNIPEIHSGDSSLSSCCPDFFKLKYAETKLFANLYVKWDNVSKGEYSFLVMVSGHELLDMLLVLSGGRCFKTQPLNLDAVSAIAWLHNLSQFTLGQFIAGAIELALWKAFGRRSEPVEVRSMSAASTCIHQLLCHCAWDQHDSLYMVYQEGQRALKDLMNCDVSLLSFFSSIMKPRVKAAVGALTANYVGSQQTPLLRLWAAASAAMSWHNSLLLFQSSMIKHKIFQPSAAWFDLMLDCFLNTPFLEMNSFTLDHKIRAKERIWNRGSLLMTSSLQHAEFLTISPRETMVPVSKPKSKKRAKDYRLTTKSDDYANTPVLYSQTKASGYSLNISLAPSSVPQNVLDRTHARIFISRVIEDIVESVVTEALRFQAFTSQHRQYRAYNDNPRKPGQILSTLKKVSLDYSTLKKSMKLSSSQMYDPRNDWPTLPKVTLVPTSGIKRDRSETNRPISAVSRGAPIIVHEEIVNTTESEQPLRGRILGSWSFGLNGSLSNDSDLSSGFFDLHRNDSTWYPSKIKLEADRKSVLLAHSSGKKDLLQKFLDDDDFWLEGQADSDQPENVGMSPQIRPWDRYGDRVILSRMSEASAALSALKVGPSNSPFISPVAVEACLDLRHISYHDSNVDISFARKSNEYYPPDSDEFTDFEHKNFLILSPDYSESSNIALTDGSIKRGNVSQTSDLSSPNFSLAVLTPHLDLKSEDSESMLSGQEDKEVVHFNAAALYRNERDNDSSTPIRSSASFDSLSDYNSNSTVSEKLASTLAEHTAAKMRSVDKRSDASEDFICINESASVTNDSTSKVNSLIDSDHVSEQLKLSIMGLELSGKAIKAAMERHKIIPKMQSIPQRRKSGDWQSLQFSKNHGFYASPNGRRFGRDDSDTRHYRRLIILDTRTPATSPTLELSCKNKHSKGNESATAIFDANLGSGSASVDVIVDDSFANTGVKHVAESGKNRVEHDPGDLMPIIEDPIGDTAGIMEDDELEESVFSEYPVEGVIDRGVTAFEDSASDISSMDGSIDAPQAKMRTRGVSDPPIRMSSEACAFDDLRGKLYQLATDEEAAGNLSVQSSLDGVHAPKLSGQCAGDINVSYLMCSLGLLRSQFESSVQVNVLAVQRSIIEYLSLTADIRSLGPHSFHQNPSAPFRQHSDSHFATSVPYNRFIFPGEQVQPKAHKTTEDISSDSFAVTSRVFSTPHSPGIRPPLPKAAAPSTLLHTLNQEVHHDRLSEIRSDPLGYSLRRRHTLSGTDHCGISVDAAHVNTVIAPLVSPQSDNGRSGHVKLRPPMTWPREKYNSGDDSVRSGSQSKDFSKQQNIPEYAVYNSIYRLGECEGGCSPMSSPLSREIKYFVSKLDLYSDAVHKSKLDVLRRLRCCVSNLWPRAQAKPFGSFVTGISLPSSDLDIVICLPKVRKEAEPNAPGVLEGRNAVKETWQQKLTQGLMREDWVNTSSIRIIPNTAVPVLKFLTKRILCENGHSVIISFDVSFEGPGHQGLEANKLILSIIRRYPALRPIVLVLKCFLSQRGLCEAFTGGLSSYVLVLMVARFLQEQSTAKDTGALLLGVLDFYGNHLDPRATGISFARACYFSRDMNMVIAPTSHAGPVPALPLTQPRGSFIRGAPVLSSNLSCHSSNQSYSLSPPIRIDIQSGFSSAPMTPVDSIFGDIAPPYLGVSYSEDYIGYVHSTPGEYPHHAGGSVIMSSGSSAWAMNHSHQSASASTTSVPHHNSASSNVPLPQQPPLFYKFDPFFVEDPLIQGNNIGRNCFRIYQVQRCWSEALNSISIQIQHLLDMYFEHSEYNSTSSQETGVIVSRSLPALLDTNPMDMSLLRILVGEMSSYRPW